MYDGVYDDFDNFLRRVVDFIKLWRTKPKSTRESALARDEIRLAQETFFGVGVYTVCELFFDAGMAFFGRFTVYPSLNIYRFTFLAHDGRTCRLSVTHGTPM